MADQTPRNQHDALLRWRDAMANELRRQSEHHLRRVLRPVGSSQGAELVIEGRRYVQFCTNNYLGLANHPEVVDAVREAASRWGVGSGASAWLPAQCNCTMSLKRSLLRLRARMRHCCFQLVLWLTWRCSPRLPTRAIELFRTSSIMRV